MALHRLQYVDLVIRALQEDLGRGGDLTTNAVFDADHQSQFVIRSRETGILAGVEPAMEAFRQLSSDVEIEVLKTDGNRLSPGDVVARLNGPTRALLTGERTALNLLGHLSGIATKTRRFVDAIHGTHASIVDIRKTLPGLRTLQKYAVTVGGGRNHRMGLDDAALLKDNHIAACGSLTLAIEKVRGVIGHTVKIEVEVDTLDQFEEALEQGPDIIMLDNFSVDDLRRAVERRNVRRPSILLETSGRVTESTVRALAETGVDVISVGGLTHSVTVLDLGMDAE